jgi:hypothetical protein
MEFSAADTVFQSLLGDDGYVSLDKFRVFFVNFEKKTGAPSEASAAVPVEANAAAPLEASTAPVALPRSIDDFFIPKTVSAPGSKKKRAVADDDADFVGDDEVESPKQKKGKKQAASGKSSSGLTKAVRTARLKSVMSSLKASVKTKKFYGNFPRPNDCNAELSCSVEEFNELFGHVGELVPNEKKTSKIITRNFTAEDLVTLFGEPSLSVQVNKRSVSLFSF